MVEQEVLRHLLTVVLSVAEFVKFLEQLLAKHNVECAPPRTAPRMLDKVSQNNE